MCTAFPRVLTTTQNSEKFSKNQLQSLKYYPEQKSDYCVKEKSQTNQNKPHQCGSHASKWKLRKRKHLHFCVGILYFSYGKKTDFFLRNPLMANFFIFSEESRQIDAVFR